ncbi:MULTISPECIES: tyrosine-type recombinase/integrase [Ralstonia solanacearum species complex]|uniref:tyrosine-type recombinase/integrase n=1 Tax=Ralstonia solanacearum species complex TaxID=3116862 RepID=UPI000E569F2B|nr:tyrosine-type recombinase/integrase [Ralstonia solanacearum]BEU74662.1 tyrosine-type recombinase/integrase [Ralstonia pseudosolanacearum]AXV79498.1 integrase [Ralstonia solanacearum]AXV93523.1 integrase [Ralstonia solanacearum]AXW21537.1 integrase [Ralstonia solanacearum]AXW78414.1 integrase [Ralstonia solanacearum]
MPVDPAAPSPDLFQPNLQDWTDQPAQAFEHWLAARGYRASSATVYRAMWRKWLRWTQARRRALADWSAADIAAFLDEAGLTKLHRYRYARLIERVFHQLALLREGTHNPASSAVQQKLAGGENDPTAFLSRAERTAIDASLAVTAAAGGAANASAFKLARDRAMVAVCHGAGLKVAQVQSLRLRQVAADLAAIIVEPARGKPYDVPLLASARPALSAWLAVRTQAEVPGERIFVADAGGRVMHAASVYRRVEAWLAELPALAHRNERLSPQTLRNGYAAALFDAGAAPAEVGHALGLRDPASAWRLRAAYTDWLAADHPDTAA